MKILSTGDVAERLGVSLHLVAAFSKRLGLGQLLGRNRALTESDVPRLRDALIAAGHLKRSAESATDETMRPLAECESRGLTLTRDDLRAFLFARFKQDIDPGAVYWPGYIIEDLVNWARENGRGKRALVTVADMIAGLRLPDLEARIAAGALLATALGAGLRIAETTPEDAEWLVFPQLSDLLGRAMAGQAEATDELEKLVTAEASAALLPRSPSKQEA